MSLNSNYNLCKADNLAIELIAFLDNIHNLSLLSLFGSRYLGYSLVFVCIQFLAHSLNLCHTLFLENVQKLLVNQLGTSLCRITCLRFLKGFESSFEIIYNRKKIVDNTLGGGIDQIQFFL